MYIANSNDLVNKGGNSNDLVNKREKEETESIQINEELH